MTYVATDRYVDAAYVPFDWYRDLVVAGAMEHGLPDVYINELTLIPVAPDPDVARAAKARRLLDGFPIESRDSVDRAADVAER